MIPTSPAVLRRCLKLVRPIEAVVQQPDVPDLLRANRIMHYKPSTCKHVPSSYFQLLIYFAELPNRWDRLQTEVHQVNFTARYLRFIVAAGHSEFATINRRASKLRADVQKL